MDKVIIYYSSNANKWFIEPNENIDYDRFILNLTDTGTLKDAEEEFFKALGYRVSCGGWRFAINSKEDVLKALKYFELKRYGNLFD